MLSIIVALQFILIIVLALYVRDVNKVVVGLVQSVEQLQRQPDSHA